MRVRSSPQKGSGLNPAGHPPSCSGAMHSNGGALGPVITTQSSLVEHCLEPQVCLCSASIAGLSLTVVHSPVTQTALTSSIGLVTPSCENTSVKCGHPRPAGQSGLAQPIATPRVTPKTS